MNGEDTELQARLRHALDAMPPSNGFIDRVRNGMRVQAGAGRQRRNVRVFAAVALALAVAAALSLVLVAGFGLRVRQESPPPNSLSGGPPAVIPLGADRDFVWLISPAGQPASTPGGAAGTAGQRVDVLDWTGALRYKVPVCRLCQNVQFAAGSETSNLPLKTTG